MAKTKSTRVKPDERILRAGRKLFFKLGFEKVSTDILAKEASVSKNTMYKYYGDMAGVLKAVVEAEAVRFEEGLILEPKTRQELQEVLISYGRNLLTFLNGRDVIRFSQLMHEEARSHPEIAHDFFASAHMKTLAALASMIHGAKEKGLLETELTAEELAEMLMGMWETIRFTKASLGISKKPFDDPGEWSTKCVKFFLTAC